MFIGLFLSVVSCLFVLYTYTTLGIGSTLGFLGENSSIFLGMISAGVMLLGIICGSLYQRISKRENMISIRQELLDMSSSSHFWTTLCVAPLVFFSTYALTSEDPMQLSSLMLSFENGFFCHSVFKELFASRS